MNIQISDSYWVTYGNGGEYTSVPSLPISKSEIPYGKIWMMFPSKNILRCTFNLFTLRDTDTVAYVLSCFSIDAAKLLEEHEECTILLNDIIVNPTDCVNTIVRTFNVSTETVRFKLGVKAVR